MTANPDRGPATRDTPARLALVFVASAVSAVAAFYFTFWMTALLLPGSGLQATLRVGLALAVAALAAVVVAQPAEHAGLGRSAAQGALLLGSLGFALGFFGPMLLAPDANQGPMLGLFLTGPGGAVLGALLGAARWLRRRGGGIEH
ncbi:MAG: hypothetical protein MUC69_08885 [Gemmatimonadales bacterium]|jgi:hypothetical protein|nr:hypothetical protein [Gemmatimonadales bacterium]